VWSSPEKYPYYLVVASIFRNEAPYLAEWIEYHLYVGAEKFFLYDNDSEDHPDSSLCPYIRDGVANCTIWPGRLQQVPAYQFALKSLRFVSLWMAFLDIDEFIVPVSARTIPAVLSGFEPAGGVIVYWMVFDSDGQLNHL
jgi:hypothetical protein